MKNKNYCYQLSEKRQGQLITMAFHRVCKAVAAYAQSQEHTRDCLQGKWHLAQQIQRVRIKAVKEFSYELAKKGFHHGGDIKFQRRIAKETRVWLRRQPSVWRVSTRTLRTISVRDIPQ